MVCASRHQGLLESTASWFHRTTGMEYSECVSACNQAMAECVRNFDPERGVRFSTYAVKAMRLRLLDARKKDRRWSRERLGDWESECDDDPSATVEFRELFGRFMDELCERDRRIVQMRMRGMAPEAIGRVLGIQRPAVCKRLLAMRGRWQEVTA